MFAFLMILYVSFIFPALTFAVVFSGTMGFQSRGASTLQCCYELAIDMHGIDGLVWIGSFFLNLGFKEPSRGGRRENSFGSAQHFDWIMMDRWKRGVIFDVFLEVKCCLLVAIFLARDAFVPVPSSSRTRVRNHNWVVHNVTVPMWCPCYLLYLFGWFNIKTLNMPIALAHISTV